MTSFSPGQNIGRYRLRRSLSGPTGQGQVWEAEEDNGHLVALKLLDPPSGNSLHAPERFRKEAAAGFQLDSRYVARLLAADPDGIPAYIAYELLSGQTLQAHLDASDLPESRRLQVLLAVARGLRDLHRRKITHGDLKPANVMVLPRSGTAAVAKLLDLGAVTFGHRSDLSQIAFGTWAFMSPEQQTGHPVNPPSDIYSFARLAVLTLTGHLPAMAGADAQLVALADEAAPLGDLLQRCLRYQPAGRPTADEVVVALSRLAVPEGGRRSTATGPTALLGSAARALAPVLPRQAARHVPTGLALPMADLRVAGDLIVDALPCTSIARRAWSSREGFGLERCPALFGRADPARLGDATRALVLTLHPDVRAALDRRCSTPARLYGLPELAGSSGVPRSAPLPLRQR